MISKEDNKNTDIAWGNLYKRLEQDGLIKNSLSTKQTVSLSKQLKWGVATAAVLLICVVSILLIINNNRITAINMLTLSNENSPSVLVSTLEDGSLVYLSQNAALQYPNHFSEDRREVALLGDAFFDISKNRERPFIIDTEEITIEVLGTSFNVKSEKSFSLSVKQGKVKVTSKRTGQSVYVKAGETTLLESNTLRTIPTADQEQFAFYLKQIHFKDQQLKDIVRVINNNSDAIKLSVVPELEHKLLTVSFYNDTPSSMARLICIAMNLEYKQENNTIIISNSKQ